MADDDNVPRSDGSKGKPEKNFTTNNAGRVKSSYRGYDKADSEQRNVPCHENHKDNKKKGK